MDVAKTGSSKIPNTFTINTDKTHTNKVELNILKSQKAGGVDLM